MYRDTVETFATMHTQSLICSRQPAMASTSARVRVLPNCQGEDPDLLPVEEAERRIRESLVPLDTAVDVPLAESLDHILAKDIVSPLNVPHTETLPWMVTLFAAPTCRPMTSEP